MIQEINLYNIKDSHVFLRADMDVPLKEDKITSTFRIKKCIETINVLVENGNKVVIFTKLGRPENKEAHLSTKNLLPELKRLLDKHVLFIRDIPELKILDKTSESVFLFENTRFFEWEEPENPKAVQHAQILSRFFEHYVDEAFAMSHRNETTNYLVPKYMGNYTYGANYQHELQSLDKIKNGHFDNPSLFILGGAKVETKLPMITKLKDKFSFFVLGGLMPKELRANPGLIDIIKSKSFVSDLIVNDFDIDLKSTEFIIEKISQSKTILWNGPTGMFENEKYCESTRSIIHALESNKESYTLIGGGDTVTAVESFGNLDNYNFVSTGGGAMFSYLADEKTNIQKLTLV